MSGEVLTGLSNDRPDIILCVELPYPPSTNRLWRNFRGRTVKTQEARSYTETCNILARASAKKQTPKAVVVLIIVYRPQKRGDLDNREKIVLDALIGAVYDDDSQVVETRKILRDDRANPRLIVVVYELQTAYRALSPGELKQMGFAHCPTCKRALPPDGEITLARTHQNELARCLDCGQLMENASASRRNRPKRKNNDRRG